MKTFYYGVNRISHSRVYTRTGIVFAANRRRAKTLIKKIYKGWECVHLEEKHYSDVCVDISPDAIGVIQV